MSRHNMRLISAPDVDALRAEAMRLLGGAAHVDLGALDRLAAATLALEGLDEALAATLAVAAQAFGVTCVLGVNATNEKTLLAGDLVALRATAEGLSARSDEAAATLGRELEAALATLGAGRYAAPSLTLGETLWRWGERTYIMGIVNATPDSFSGDGLLDRAASSDQAVCLAVEQGLTFLEQGADIVDVGGESTRPGGEAVDTATELRRVVPVIEALRAQTRAPLSVDTYKAEVARAALDAGADMVNDVWGLQMDPGMAPLVAEAGVPVVIMHNHSRPRDAAQEARLGGRYVGSHYDNLWADVLRELREQVDYAIAAGIDRARILVDPGIGFGKTVEQNLTLLNHVDQLRSLGLPILLGPSRKSFIGYTLDLPQDERMEGTAAAVALGIARGGADVIRVHDVRVMARVARMSDAIVRAH